MLISDKTDLQVEKTFNEVPVEIENVDKLRENSGLSIISGDDYVIDITIKGNRVKMASVERESIKAKVDVSGITDDGVYSLAVRVDTPPSSGFTVVDQSRTTIDVSVDVLTEKNFDISVNPIMTHSENYSTEETVNPSEITVSGPQELLKLISSVSVNPNLGMISGDVSFNDRILILDKYGKEIVSPYITLSSQYAEGTVRLIGNEEANEKTTKTVPLVCSYKYGYYNDKNCSYVISPAEVTISGLKKDVDKVDSIDVCTIDETMITSTTVFQVTAESPKGTVIVGDKKVTVSIDVKDVVESLEITIGDIAFDDALLEGFSAEAVGPYSIVLYGVKEDLANIAALVDSGEYPFDACVDMSLVERADTYSLPLTVKFDSEFANVWYGAKNITVLVKES